MLIPIKAEGSILKIDNKINDLKRYVDSVKKLELFEDNKYLLQEYLNSYYQNTVALELVRGKTAVHYFLAKRKIKIPVYTYALGVRAITDDLLSFIKGFCLSFVDSMVKSRSSENHYYIERISPELSGEIIDGYFVIKIRVRLAQVHVLDMPK